MVNTRRRDLLLAGLAAGLAGLTGNVGAKSEPPLKLGIMPFNSSLALLRTHGPLRDFLAARLGRPVEMFTSADYFTFINEALSGKFDLLITAPHVGVMCLEKGYQPLVRYTAVLSPLLAVPRGSAIVSAQGLRGKRIAIAQRLAIIPIGGIRWLEEQGLRLGQDFRVVEYPTHGAAVAAAAAGEADAAFVPNTLFNQVPEDVRSRVSVMPTSFRVPHVMTLAHQRLGTAEIERIRLALMAFSTAAEGRPFFEQTGYEGYQSISAADIQVLKPYAALARKMMALGE